MYLNTPNHKNIDLEGYETSFKEKIQWVLDKIKSIFNKTSESNNSELNNHLDLRNPTIKNKIIEIKQTTEPIARYLKAESLMEAEYYDFREIQRLMFQSLDYGSIDELRIISNILNEFIELIEFKIKLAYPTNSQNINFKELNEESKFKYERRYKEFIHSFFNWQREYYTIFEGDNEEDVSEYFQLMKNHILN